MLQADQESQGAPLEAAFRRRWEAWAYLGAVVLVVALPVLLALLGLPARRTLYREMPYVAASFPFLEKEVFEERADIDVLFLGPSILWAAIDAPMVRDALRPQLEHEPVVLSLGYHSRGADEMTYLLLHDILEHRTVRTAFITMPRPRDSGELQRWSYRFMDLRTAENVSFGLPFDDRFQFFGATVLGTPRTLLGILRRGRQGPIEHLDTLGWLAERHGWDDSAFVPFSPQVPSYSPEALEPRAMNARFPEGDKEPTVLQRHFQQRILDEAREHRVQVAAIYVPIFDDRRIDGVPSQADWQTIIGRSFTTIGASPSSLFAGLSDEQVKLLYYNFGHLNVNGAHYFTSAILPALLEMSPGGKHGTY